MMSVQIVGPWRGADVERDHLVAANLGSLSETLRPAENFKDAHLALSLGLSTDASHRQNDPGLADLHERLRVLREKSERGEVVGVCSQISDVHNKGGIMRRHPGSMGFWDRLKICARDVRVTSVRVVGYRNGVCGANFYTYAVKQPMPVLGHGLHLVVREADVANLRAQRDVLPIRGQIEMVELLLFRGV